MMRRFLIGTALVMALVLAWLAWDGWIYLQRGYSLSIGLPGQPRSISHIDFPTWRATSHIFLWMTAMGAIVGYVTGRSWASKAAWLTFAATFIVGIYDVVQYGTMGSPTSIWTVLLLLLLALLARLGPIMATSDGDRA